MRWPFRKRTQDRALWDVGEAWPGPSTMAGVNVGPDTALRLAAVWACVRILSDVVSTLPLDLTDEATRRPVDKPTILVRPSAYCGWHEWIGQVMWSTLLTGAAYGLIVARSGAGMQPTQIELIDPARVTVVLKPDRLTVEYRFDGQVIERGEELWVFNGHRFPGIPWGLSPIRYHAETIGLGIAAGRWGGSFFGRECRPAGVLTFDGTANDDDIRELTEHWREQHMGVRRIAVLEKGLDYKPIEVPPEEAQFLDTQRLNLQQICGIYGVPVELIGSGVTGESITYSNVVDRPLTLLKFGVQPWLVRLEAALAELLPRGMVAKFDPAGLLRADQKTRYESYTMALDAGWLTVNEVRAQEDLPPLPAGERPRLEAVS